MAHDPDKRRILILELVTLVVLIVAAFIYYEVYQ